MTGASKFFPNSACASRLQGIVFLTSAWFRLTNLWSRSSPSRRSPVSRSSHRRIRSGACNSASTTTATSALATSGSLILPQKPATTAPRPAFLRRPSSQFQALLSNWCLRNYLPESGDSARPTSRSRRRFRRRLKAAAISAPAPAHLFALLGRHLLPTLGHAFPDPPARVMTPAAMAKTVMSEKNPAQNQDAQPLPKGDHAPSEQRWQQPVTQQLHDLPADEDEQSHPHDRRRNHPDQSSRSPPHISVPHAFVNSL